MIVTRRRAPPESEFLEDLIQSYYWDSYEAPLRQTDLTVTEIYPSHVVLDGNHPLAGLALRIALKVLDVRDATDEEIAAGSVGSSLVAFADTAGPDEPLH